MIRMIQLWFMIVNNGGFRFVMGPLQVRNDHWNLLKAIWWLGEPPWLKKPPNMNQLRSNQNGNMTINNLAIYDITSNNDIMKYMDT